MQAYVVLVRRELGAYFASMTGYLITSVVLLLLGLSFCEVLERLNVEPTDAPVTEQFFITVYFWLVVLLPAPVITMRVFAFEKLTGTYETLMTAPVRDWQVVLAKFTGALIVYLLTWLPMIGYLLVVGGFSNDPSILNWRTLGSTFLGLMLIGSVFLSMGCLSSAFSKSQLIAAIFGYGLVFTFFFVSLSSLRETRSEGLRMQILEYLSMPKHMEDFARGTVDTRYLVLYVSLTGFFLFLTTRVVESRRWR